MSRWFLAATSGVLLWASVAQSQSIDIILDPDAPVCSAQVGGNPWIELHVVAMTGPELTSFAATQFRVSGMPDTWNEENVSWVWDASVTLAYGNPLFAATSGLP